MSTLTSLGEANSSGATMEAAPAEPPLALAARPAGQAAPHTLQLSGAALLRGLLVCLLIVTALHLMVVASYAQGHDFRGATRFYFDNEGNLPAYFSTFILFVAAVLLSVIALFKRADEDRFFRHWLMMAWLFFAMALDEALSFHELLIDPLRSMLGLSGLMRFSWVIVGAVFVLVFVVAYVPFLMHLKRSLRCLFFASGVVYVTGAIGFEVLGGPYYEVYEAGGSSFAYMVLMTIEEILEMCGILLFIHTLLTYLKAYRPTFSVWLQ